MQIELRPELDRRLIAQIFKTQGRVRIPDALAPSSAQALFKQLSAQTPWQLSLNAGKRHVDLAHQQLMLMSPEQRETMTQRLLEQVPARLSGRVREFSCLRPLSGRPARASIAGHARISEFPAIPAIRTRSDWPAGHRLCRPPGHQVSARALLTEHDDEVAGKRRLAAYFSPAAVQARYSITG
ncbi:MAG TPA: hypothetical protein VNR40_12685 [Steroidobacter sp.]|nr:hypothetical protein [Steroidobacter sp.]